MRNNLVNKLLISLFFFISFFNLTILPGFSQGNSFIFSHVDVNHGLSGNSIKCIYQDSKGFVWFGTNNGLSRFDGYKFEIFRNNADSTTILDNNINVITEDNEGNLWVGTRKGISVLNNNTYKFHTLSLSQTPPFRCPDIEYITSMSSDQGGNIMIGTHNGLFYFTEKDNTITQILLDEKVCISPVNNITAIISDHLGFWIGTMNGMIYYYDKTSKFFRKIETNGLRLGSISKLFLDNKNFLWVGDVSGLHSFDIRNNKWDRLFQERIETVFKNLQINGIDQDKENNIWVSTDGRGAFIIDSSRKNIINLTNIPYSEGSLTSNGLSTLYCDKAGIVWIGTSKKGVDFHKKIRKFNMFRNLPTQPNSLNNNDVNCISEDGNGNILIGTNGGGLNIYNPNTRKFYRSLANLNSANISSDIIVSIFEDSDRKIWIGTYLGGLNCIDPETGKITVFRHSDTDSTTISDDRVWGICEDSNKNLWIATLTSGLNLLDRKTGKFKRFNTENHSICFNYINSITPDEKGNLWLSTANGLTYFNPLESSSKCYYNNLSIPGSLSDNHVISTFKDSRGLFWVCTDDGLNLMNSDSNTFKVFREKDGLPSNQVLKVIEDNDGCLWISTRNGISKLTVGKSGSGDDLFFNFINYGISDGLQGKEFNESSALKTKNGELWFGGPDGLNVFYPSDIKAVNSVSKIILTNLRIDNRVIKVGEVINNRVLLDKPIFNADRITLKYIENSFTIDFAVLNFFFPERNKYVYNLEGFNEKWISTDGMENHATFSNLKNGKYIFRVKGTNLDGTLNELPATLEIKVLPPIWKSWYSYLFYLIILTSILFFLRYLTLYKERLNTQLKHEYLKSQHIHEIDLMKIKFLTNISHEFRTPLSLIFSPAEKLILKLKDKPEEKYLIQIMQNAKRLLFMVNQLLDFRKMEVQGFRYNPSLGDIIAVIEDSVLSFKGLADQKCIKLEFISDIEELNTFFDKDKLEKIVFNLISNAIKFTHVKGSVKVWIHSSQDDNLSDPVQNLKPSRITIRVEDSGIGISPDKTDRLFSSFYQIDSAFSGDQGSGIGLSLVKEFVKLHDGEINVESEPDKGSCFIITLPVITTIKALKNKEFNSADSSDYPIERSINDYGPDNILKEKPTLIIVDDNDDLRFYLKDNFKIQYNVYEASNGNDALILILKIVPDLIISDIMMPGMNGIELCKKVKSDHRICHIPLILLTAHSSSEDQSEYLNTGADDCIVKPFSFQMLEAKISNLIRIRKSLKQTFSSSIRIEPNDIDITSLDEKFIHKVLELVEKNISNTNYTVEELSSDICMSRSLLYKKILSLTGKSPLDFIRTFRLRRAAQLLQKSQLQVSEVAFRVGFNDPKYFRKHFKNEYGVIPSKYSDEFRMNGNKDQLTPKS